MPPPPGPPGRTAEAKARAWTDIAENPDVPNETHRSIAVAFMRHGQEELLEPYVEKYLEAADTIWERARHPHGVQHPRGRLPGAAGQPRPGRAARPLARRVAGQPAAKRYVREGRADVIRALAAQAKDA